MNNYVETKLTRKLWMRGKHKTYPECQRVVLDWLRRTDLTFKQIAQAIDDGHLDPGANIVDST